MALTFAEGLIDEIIVYLTANLASNLDTEGSPGLVLRVPTEYIKREPSDPRAPTRLPVVFVIVPRTTIVEWHEGSAASNHVLWIYLLDQNTNPELLRSFLYQYALGIWKTLVAHQFDTATWKMGIGTPPVFDFGETLTRGSVSIADVKIELQYEKLEIA